MSADGNGTNGNGTNGNGNTANNSASSVPGIPFAKGDDPRRGHGLKGRAGRPSSEIRAKVRGSFDERVAILEEIADDPKADPADRLKAVDILGKYGLGGMTTGTLDVTHRSIDDVLLERARRRGNIAAG